MTGPLDELDALLSQMKRDHAVGATLPNRAGLQVKAAGERIQGYADVLEGALRHLREGRVTPEENTVKDNTVPAYHDPETNVTLVGTATPQGVHLGVRAAQPWYAAGVHILPGHPAEGAARALVGALAPSPVAARPEGTVRAALEALAAEWEGGADLDPALDDLGDLAEAGARRACARQLRALLRGADGGTP